MAEYDDVLTNQPVVIDNVRLARICLRPLLTRDRDLVLSKLDLLVKSIQSRSFPRSMSFFACQLPSLPSYLLQSVGRPKHVRVMAGALEGDVFIGRRAQEYRGLLKIRYPMEHGVVTNWDDMEKIWNWVYQEELGTLSEEVRR